MNENREGEKEEQKKRNTQKHQYNPAPNLGDEGTLNVELPA
jgi:hypothetical protein